MYLSSLFIDVGDNPDRPRPGRLWLRNLYHVHQRLCMAFPSATKTSDDPHFLKPFKPEDFGHSQVHVGRGPDSGFLFRIDPIPGGHVMIIVQSAIEADWRYAFHNADYLLAASPEMKSFDPCFANGQRLQFRLMANPTRKIDTKSGLDGRRRHGKRVPVANDDMHGWLARRSEPAGFSVEKDSVTVQAGYIYVSKALNGNGHRLRSVRYDGVLNITEPTRFREILVSGIGSGKAFGFGLLSVAPI